MNDFAECDGGETLIISTDTFVVEPYIFLGGDIGKLSVCGTVNDVAVGAATVKYLTVGFILEEGFRMDHLEKICASMQKTAREAGAIIVSGDTKVVPRGAADGIFINVTGVGIKQSYRSLGGECVNPGDKVIVSGNIGDHGVAILSERENLSFSTDIISDCAPLNRMIESEREKLLRLEEVLHQRVVGQEEAITAVADAVRRSRAGLQDEKRPIGSFIFLGTTGVGKTELAKTLSDFLFNDEKDEERLIQRFPGFLLDLDYNNFLSKHKLI